MIDLTLTDKEQQQWQEYGYFVRTHCFKSAELTAITAAVQRATVAADQQARSGSTYYLDGKKFVDIGPATVQYEHTDDAAEVRVLEPVHLFDPEIDALLDDPRLTVPMQGLIGKKALALWTVKLNLKPPGGSAFGWHQDSPYWMHNCDHVDLLPNVMLALDDQTETNGCFRVIRGSHKRGILPGTNDGSQLGGFFTDPQQFDLGRQDKLEVAAGSLIFFSPHSVHGSEENLSTSSRRALIATYQPAGHPTLKTGKPRSIKTSSTS